MGRPGATGRSIGTAGCAAHRRVPGGTFAELIGRSRNPAAHKRTAQGQTGRCPFAWLRIDESITVAARSSHHAPLDDCRQALDSCCFGDPELSGREPVEQRASEPFGCVLDMLLESTCVARFAAETAFQSDRAATAASRVSHALARLMEEGQPTLQHGLERWLVRRLWWHYPVPNRGTRETADTYFLG